MNKVAKYEQFSALVGCYCRVAVRLLALVKSGLGAEGNLIPFVRRTRLPARGSVNGVQYTIHGGGVEMSRGGVTIDVELGQDDYATAFDAWRLSLFATSVDSESAFADADSATVMLSEALRRGDVVLYPPLGDTFFTVDAKVG